MSKKTDKMRERIALKLFSEFAPKKLRTIRKNGEAQFSEDERGATRLTGEFLTRRQIARARAGRKPRGATTRSGSGSSGSSGVAARRQSADDFGLFAVIGEEVAKRAFSNEETVCFERGLEIVAKYLENLVNQQQAAAAARRSLKKIMKTDAPRRAKIQESRSVSAKAMLQKRDGGSIDHRIGGYARRDALTPEERSQIARRAAEARWARARGGQPEEPATLPQKRKTR